MALAFKIIRSISPALLCFLIITFGLFIQPAQSIKCFVCGSQHENKKDNSYLCEPLELYGREEECPNGVTTCYKSWSVEADPKTVRHCGSRRDIIEEGTSVCGEKLIGSNKAIVCKCNTDTCNGSENLKTNSIKILFLSTLTLMLLII